MGSDGKYEALSFESSIFEQDVWRLNSVEYAQDVVTEALKNNVALISYREDDRRQNTTGLTKVGFYPVETLITLENDIPNIQKMPPKVSIGSKENAEDAADIGHQCFTHDRYHSDAHISNDIADKIKSKWVFNSVSGRADCVFLYKQDHEVIGFNACMLKNEVAFVDLIGVLPAVQGQGVGHDLMIAMFCHYKGKAKSIQLGTQVKNLRSINFYKKMGFKEVCRNTTWHWVPSL